MSDTSITSPSGELTITSGGIVLDAITSDGVRSVRTSDAVQSASADHLRGSSPAFVLEGRNRHEDEGEVEGCSILFAYLAGTGQGLPFRVELPEAQYLVLLKRALNRSRAAARLAVAVEHEGKGKKSYYRVSGFLTDGLALRAIALVHAPEALPAIERELERARKK